MQLLAGADGHPHDRAKQPASPRPWPRPRAVFAALHRQRAADPVAPRLQKLDQLSTMRSTAARRSQLAGMRRAPLGTSTTPPGAAS